MNIYTFHEKVQSLHPRFLINLLRSTDEGYIYGPVLKSKNTKLQKLPRKRCGTTGNENAWQMGQLVIY